MWKFLDLKGDKIVSRYDQSEWEIGKWRKEKPPVEECVGLNASLTPLEALSYVKGTVLAQVEVRGKIIKGEGKWTCEEMRIVKAWRWEKRDSVALSICSAKLCLKNFEKLFPNDGRPRKAIEAAREWLKNPTEEESSAAWSAARSAARSAALKNINSWIIKHTKEMDEL